MYKFYGNPLQAITSKFTMKTIFTFDTKGEFYTDDDLIIERAKGFFDYKIVEVNQDGKRIAKTNFNPPTTIVNNHIEKLRHCKKCNETFKNQGDLLNHYRVSHKEG